MAKSIAAQQAVKDPSTELAKLGDFQLPAIFGQNSAITVIPRFTTPYLSFAQPAAKDQWSQFMRKFPDIEDGDPVLVFPEPEPMIRPNPLKMTIVAAKQYYATRDVSKGGIELDRFSKPGKDRAERIFAALIVYLPDVAVPCTCVFKTVKCACAQTISAEIERASSPDWIKNGAEFEMAVAACASPFSRVVGTVSINSKTGRGTGMPYRVARATVAPSGPNEWKLLAALQTDEGMKKMQAVADAYNNRLAELAIK